MTTKPIWLTSANTLKFAAVLIAAPRYIGAFGVSLGVAATELYPQLIDVELATGAAMAILEGFAIAFMVSRTNQLRPGSAQLKILATIATVLLFTLPVIGLPYLLAEQTGIGPFAAFSWLQITWSLVVLSVPVLIVIGVALADYDPAKSAIYQLEQDSLIKAAKLNTKPVVAKPIAEPVATPTNGKLPIAKIFSCECGRYFETEPALRGHKAHCKLKLQPVNGNGKVTK
jgi:hypothetical protein